MPKSVRRTLDLLNLLGSDNQKYSIAEISRMSELPPSTVHRLLAVLKEYGFAEQDPFTQDYYLGPSLISLGLKARNYVDLRKTGYKALKDLTDETLEDSYLAVVDGYTGVFLEQVKGPQALKVFDALRTSVPLHCGAIRKVLLANSDSDFIEDYASRELESFTDKTIDSKEALVDNLMVIKEQGYAISQGEYVKDGSGIAAPVRDYTGEVIASIGIIGPSSRIDDAKETLIKSVRRRAELLSKELGYK
ncbi:IclR family transcriptional regulator [Acidaminobacter sp. JC074]|uniref:IclR family transcriptional regulator n=1 Tax=Acidaminobacter sp. JC074 TaxID=2530199 RepID=UPI001F0E5D67|nr:IclR family transcriptional regulator [Acidaminobacter sp. JC074]